MSGTIRFESVSVGDALPPLVKPPISRLQLALFAGTSGDHNPIHVDDEAAKVGGLPGVIAHGMLNMAFLGQLLTGWAPPNRLRAFSNRFAAMAYPGDVITLTGTVTAKKEEAGERRVELEIFASNQKGDKLLVGAATVALD